MVVYAFLLVFFLLIILVLCFSQDGRTALMNAAVYGHLDVVALLLEGGANIEAADNVIRRVTI